MRGALRLGAVLAAATLCIAAALAQDKPAPKKKRPAQAAEVAMPKPAPEMEKLAALMVGT